MNTKPFPPPGLSYLWFLNDACAPAHIDRLIDGFARGGAGAVVLHPRAGLLMPYGGADWFDFIRRTAHQCAARGLNVWLYDEDPYPSGGAGGKVVLDHPEFEAYKIEMYTAAPDLGSGDLFCFPQGRLLWAGLIPVERARTPAAAPVDLTARVGLVRREWRTLKPWDSRWYYPATPRYVCDRADAYTPEHALKAPAIPDGMRLVAFVAVRSGTDSVWGTLPDTLNPAATQCFLALTHERYKAAVGDLFGREIKAMFTDEPKYFGGRPWTPGLFEAFEQAYGYDLRPRLADLFSESRAPQAMLTRIHYREWCGRRFEEAWLRPVAAWCHAHQLKLVGHISPEDDPVEQANCVSNLFPLMKHFDLAGIDLIIPAVGDRRHPLLNIGAVTAASVAAQQDKSGVMSESLGCSGHDFTAADARRILAWQTVMGITTPVVHGAFSSIEGERADDAPPDFGPLSPRWKGMVAIGEELAPIQEHVIGARQVAPVAILWPIRSFQADARAWQEEGGGLRGALADLVLACLERQVGVHLLDEDDLCSGTVEAGCLRLGKAAYSHIIVPPCAVLREESLQALDRLAGAGLGVFNIGPGPTWAQTDRELLPVRRDRLPAAPAGFLDALPRLARVEGPGAEHVRCTAWERDSVTRLLLINISSEAIGVRVDGAETRLPAGSPLMCG